MTTELQS